MVIAVGLFLYSLSLAADNARSPKGVDDVDHKAVPVRLVIPAINVDAEIEPLGVTASGAMDVPKSPDTVGWLSTNSIPGNVGNAVMDGHRGWMNQMSAVFDRLHELKSGDLIYVTDAAGTSTSFVVREIKSYAPGDDASEVFGTSTGAHLNLITCEGDWDAWTQSYAERLVVFSKKII